VAACLLGANPVTAEFCCYEFDCIYGNGDTYSGSVFADSSDGDYYSGTVYAPKDCGYSASYTKTTIDENAYIGTYVITGVSTTTYDGSKADQIYVTSYYNHEGGKIYTPVSNGSAVGSSYLASKHDYIIQSDLSQYYFGRGYYESDVEQESLYFFYLLLYQRQRGLL